MNWNLWLYSMLFNGNFCDNESSASVLSSMLAIIHKWQRLKPLKYDLCDRGKKYAIHLIELRDK
jgi:hypothetical protein